MAVAYVDHTQLITTSGAAQAPTLPTHSEGDLLLAMIVRRFGALVSVPAGWTKEVEQDFGGSSVTVAWKIADAGETDPTFDTDPFEDQWWFISLLAYSGVDATSPIQDAATATGGTVASLTGSADGVEVCQWIHGNSTGAISPPGSMTARVQTTTPRAWTVADEQLVADGATGTRVASGSTQGNAGVTIAAAAASSNTAILLNHLRMMRNRKNG